MIVLFLKLNLMHPRLLLNSLLDKNDLELLILLLHLPSARIVGVGYFIHFSYFLSHFFWKPHERRETSPFVHGENT